MCEPYLSIVQIPDQDDSGTPTEARVDAILPPTDSWASMKKRIGSWFHFSHAAHGHSEVLQRLSISGRCYLPQETKYETSWAWRSTKIDGSYNGLIYEQQSALEAATDYGKLVATGNMTVLRQFLERSISKTNRPWSYYETFCTMLTKEGRYQLGVKMKRYIGLDKAVWFGRAMLRSTIRIILGFTRVRKLLIPEWSDDNLLWG